MLCCCDLAVVVVVAVAEEEEEEAAETCACDGLAVVASLRRMRERVAATDGERWGRVRQRACMWW